MIEEYKFVGKERKPKINLAGRPAPSSDQIIERELESFSQLYINEVTEAIRKSKGAAPYENLPSQIGAFDRLLESLKNMRGFTLISVQSASYEEPWFKVHVSFKIHQREVNEHAEVVNALTDEDGYVAVQTKILFGLNARLVQSLLHPQTCDDSSTLKLLPSDFVKALQLKNVGIFKDTEVFKSAEGFYYAFLPPHLGYQKVN